MCVNVQPFLNECVGTARRMNEIRQQHNANITYDTQVSPAEAFQNRFYGQSINQSINQSIDQSINQLIHPQDCNKITALRNIMQLTLGNYQQWISWINSSPQTSNCQASASRHSCLGRNKGELSTEVDWVDIVVDAEGEGVSDHVSGVETPGVKRCSMWRTGPTNLVVAVGGAKLRPFRSFSFNSLRMHSNKAWSWCSKDAMVFQFLGKEMAELALVSTVHWFFQPRGFREYTTSDAKTIQKDPSWCSTSTGLYQNDEFIAGIWRMMNKEDESYQSNAVSNPFGNFLQSWTQRYKISEDITTLLYVWTSSDWSLLQHSSKFKEKSG